MHYITPCNTSDKFTLHEAVFGSGGRKGVLFLPTDIPSLPRSIINNLPEMNLPEIGYVVLAALLGKDIPLNVIKSVVNESLTFELPLESKTNNVYVADFSHGPTGSKYDFSALPFSLLLKHCRRGYSPNHKLNILAPGIFGNGMALTKALMPFESINLFVIYPNSERNKAERLLGMTHDDGIETILAGENWETVYDVLQHFFNDSLADNLEVVRGDISNMAFLLPLVVPVFAIFANLKRLNRNIQGFKLITSARTFDLYIAATIAKRMGLPVECVLTDADGNNAFSTPHHSFMQQFLPDKSIDSLIVDYNNAIASATPAKPVVNITDAGHMKQSDKKPASAKKPKIYTNLNSLYRLIES